MVSEGLAETGEATVAAAPGAMRRMMVTTVVMEAVEVMVEPVVLVVMARMAFDMRLVFRVVPVRPFWEPWPVVR